MAGLEHALSTYSDADITVLHVMNPFVPTGSDDPPLPDELVEGWTAPDRERAEAILEDATERADERGVEVLTALEVGEPWRRIVEYAADNDVDHIVIGSHGADASPSTLGSVAEAVLRRTDALVSVVR